MHRRFSDHSSHCSSIMAPTSLLMAPSFGKMPTTLVRRLISAFNLSSEFVLLSGRTGSRWHGWTLTFLASSLLSWALLAAVRPGLGARTSLRFCPLLGWTRCIRWPPSASGPDAVQTTVVTA
jgi:hypothetical protein